MNSTGKKDILEAVAIAILTTIGNKIVEHIYNKLKREEKKEKDEAKA